MLQKINNPEISKYRIDEKELKYFLEERKGMKYKKTARCKVPEKITGWAGSEPNILWLEENMRHYHFLPEKWLTEEEYIDFKEAFDPDAEPLREKAQPGEPVPPGGTFPEAEKLDNKQYKLEDQLKINDNPPPW